MLLTDISRLRLFRLQLFWLKLLNTHIGFFPHLAGHIVGIPPLVYDPRDAGINKHLGADDTGEIGTVEGGAVDGNPMIGGLYNGVLLGVQPPTKLVPLA
jgi:hypothetical protein